METKLNVKKARKGIVGIEAAIVLIAFVIVAAALAFVVLNMGFTTTQKSKETMSSGLSEASSALEIDGTVLAKADTGTQKVTVVAIPLKLASGKAPIDMSRAAVSIVYYDGSSWHTETVSLNSSMIITSSATTDITQWSGSYTVELHFYMGDGDAIFESGDKAILYIKLSNGAAPYSKVHIEIKPPVGAPLTVERMIPSNLTDQVVVLG